MQKLLLVLATLIGAASPASAANVKIVGFGDSLMAGYQLAETDGFTGQLANALKGEGIDAEMINAGVSGDTTSGGMARLDWSVPEGADIVILELGANDALRGIAPEITMRNLDEMIVRLKEKGSAVVLAGMLAPPNMGKDYEEQFNPIFPRLAEKHGVPLIPFFLEGVAANPKLQLADGMHPNADGVAVMVANALPVIRDAIAALK